MTSSTVDGMTMNRHDCLFSLGVLLALVVLLPTGATPQSVIPQTMTRPKMWIKANPNGSLERESNLGLSGHDWELAYPGYYDNRNEASGGFDDNAIYHGAEVYGERVAWMYRNNFNAGNIFAILGTSLLRNYNLTNPNAPEEMISGTIGSDTVDGVGKRHMGYKLEGRVMGWSQPRYDDFLIIKCKLTSTDTDTLRNFYYARFLTPDGPYRPSSVSSGWDGEYLWDPAVSDTIGFIFYDGTSIPPTGAPPVYSIPPGDSTGNAGDPGNIGTQGSRDFRLYSPNLYAYSFPPYTIPPNKNGERKIWRKIVSTSSSAPDEERMPAWNSAMTEYQTMVEFITQEPQPPVSWRDAHNANPPIPFAGSLYERNPRYLYAIGPYDIAPGRSIEWTEIFLAGAMSRDSTICRSPEELLYATTNFVQRGLVNLKENWVAARTLIANNYRFPSGQIPPPTPANAPRTGNANGLGTANPELLVVPGETITDGRRVAGVRVTWNAVHVGYRDPQTLRRDFLAYKIYRSENTVEGPWKLDSLRNGTGLLSIPEADSLRHLGADSMKISYFVPTTPGIPYRFCVTSIDSGGNESGKTAYSYYPVSSEPNPSNNVEGILVVPNPFRQVSGYADQSENKRLAFMNIPAQCTIRIYTLALDLVRTLEHDGAGLAAWGSQANQDYMLTDFGQNVMPGIYIYHVESHVPGHEGQTAVGKFAIIR